MHDAQALHERWKQLTHELEQAAEEQEQWITTQRGKLALQIQELARKIDAWEREASERYAKALSRKRWSPLSWLRFVFAPTRFALLQELWKLEQCIKYPPLEEEPSQWYEELQRLKSKDVLLEKHTNSEVILLLAELSKVEEQGGYHRKGS